MVQCLFSAELSSGGPPTQNEAIANGCRNVGSTSQLAHFLFTPSTRQQLRCTDGQCFRTKRRIFPFLTVWIAMSNNSGGGATLRNYCGKWQRDLVTHVLRIAVQLLFLARVHFN